MTQNTLILNARVRNRCWGRNPAQTSFRTESPDKSWLVQLAIIYFSFGFN